MICKKSRAGRDRNCGDEREQQEIG
jgi:hypothetical protein